MSVKRKTTLIFVISFLFITACAFMVFNFVIARYINNIETDNINESFNVINSIFDREKMNMKKQSLDWSVWDDTYEFLSGENKQSYIESNLQDNTLNQLNLNFMIFIDKNGKMFYNLSNGINHEIKSQLVDKLINNSKQSITFKNNNEVHSGILNASNKLFIISASPITTSDGKSKSNGSLIMGRYIDNSLLSYINSIAGCKVNMLVLTGAYKESNGMIVKNSNLITAYRSTKDVNGNMSIVTSISMKRNEYNLGIFYFKVFVVIFSTIMAITIFAIIVIFDKTILERLNIVNKFIDKVSNTKTTNARVNVLGNDEISNIANSINNMLISLDCANKDILDISYCDELTGLRNRSYIKKNFEGIDNQTSYKYSIIFGDVNGLKLVNDTFGHSKGDKLIFTIGKILKDQCSQDDIVARWGGDEFIIIAINKDSSYISYLIQKIRGECRKVTEFGFEISIALGSAQNSGAYKMEETISLAEKIMYRSKLTDKKSSRNATLLSLEKTLYEKHSETEEHTERVKNLSIKIGEKLNLSQDKLNELELVSLLHDIGKIGIPDHILMKPGRLTSEEWETMKQHCEIGYRIAKATSELCHVADEILCHHEKFDGTGYPQGIKGKAIPIISRIVNVADSFDVMTHKRIYKNAYDIEYAKEEIKRCSGTQFDPDVVNKFMELLEEADEKVNV